MQVRILFTDPGQRLELEREQIRLLDVPIAAAETDHRVVFNRLVDVAALQATELVGAEVSCAIDHRPRVECPGNPADGFDHLVDQLTLLTVRDQVTRVTVGQRLGEHELGAQQPDPVDRLARHGPGRIRHREVDVNLRRGDLDGARHGTGFLRHRDLPR